MLDRLKKMADRYEEIQRLMSQPEIAGEPAKMSVLAKEFGRLRRPHELYQRIAEVSRGIEEAKRNTDPELAELAKQDLDRLLPDQEKLFTQVEEMFLDEESGGNRGAVVEIRPGTGGEEAALFASDLFRMYVKFIEGRGWKMEILDYNATELGGLKNASFSVEGNEVYKQLRHEGGTHRVQRVPKTEAGGRIHTSAATVAVIPETDDIELDIKKEELEVTTARAGGPGGQHVNKTESAIQIVHLPTGIRVQCRSDRSQMRNRELAMKLLRARLLEHFEGRQKSAIANLRKTQIGSGDRSEKIRTYNFPQNRVTDHRINLTVHNLAEVINGALDELVAGLVEAERSKKVALMRKQAQTT
ncbi:MAG TPA: peptide chain release factor 1 [Planctomycetota bacterium]|nr:peptide chain release factor 1 [Planctomycetota bacterium]